MQKQITFLLGFLALLGCVAFVYGVGQACVKSWPHGTADYDLPEFLSSTVISIAAVFATNLGAVLGISVNNPNSILKEKEVWNPLSIFRNPSPLNFQIIACYIYIVALIASSIVWAHRDFTNEVGVITPLIPELSKSLLGVIVGALAVVLNAQNSKHS